MLSYNHLSWSDPNTCDAVFVKAVESVKGEPWNDFANRHGDWGRDMALYVGRLSCGLTLKELGGYTGMRTPAVCLGTLRVK